MLAPAALPAFAKAPMTKMTKTTKITRPMGKMVDINSASASELDAVKGIGPATARKIIAGRPYKGKDDLLSRKIVNKGQYAMIRDCVIARQGKMTKVTKMTKTTKMTKGKM